MAADSMTQKQDLDLAHFAFINALDMDRRGLRAEADSLWYVASQADPKRRFLAFAVAQRFFDAGMDSAAVAMAQRANQLPGKHLA